MDVSFLAGGTVLILATEYSVMKSFLLNKIEKRGRVKRNFVVNFNMMLNTVHSTLPVLS